MKPVRRYASSFDAAIRMLSQSANKGRIWLLMAAVGAMVPGRTRRAAIRATGSLAATSIVVNAVVKPLSRRGRPDIMPTPLYRRLTRQPWSTSLPSGHAASAAAFATGAGLEYPAAGAAIAPIAAAVGYTSLTRSAVDLDGDDQDTVLKALEAVRERAEDPDDPGAFFDTIREDTIDGMFVDLLYGGRRGLVGWVMIGYPGSSDRTAPALSARWA